MSSYALLARLSNLEGDAGTLQTTVDALSISKQDAITNAPVVEGHAIKVGSVLNKIGTKDSTLSIETTGNIIKLAVDKNNIQEKLTAIADATASKAVLSGGTIRSIGVDDTLSIAETSNVIKVAVDKNKIQEKLTTIADNSGGRALLVGKEVKGLAADTSVNIISWTAGTLQVSVNKDVIQENLTPICLESIIVVRFSGHILVLVYPL